MTFKAKARTKPIDAISSKNDEGFLRKQHNEGSLASHYYIIHNNRQYTDAMTSIIANKYEIKGYQKL